MYRFNILISFAPNFEMLENLLHKIIFFQFVPLKIPIWLRNRNPFFAGVLCDHYLKRMSEFIGEEWISLGRNLGIPDRDLRLLQIDYKDKTERNFKLLDTFRLSRTAIEQGTGVIRFLLRACKGAGCTAGLITFVRYVAGIFQEQTFMRSQSWLSLSSAMPSVEIT